MFIVYVLFIVYVTLPPGISPIAVGINNNNNNNNNNNIVFLQGLAFFLGMVVMYRGLGVGVSCATVKGGSHCYQMSPFCRARLWEDSSAMR
jgi:hypothetical protein